MQINKIDRRGIYRGFVIGSLIGTLTGCVAQTTQNTDLSTNQASSIEALTLGSDSKEYVAKESEITRHPETYKKSAERYGQLPEVKLYPLRASFKSLAELSL